MNSFQKQSENIVPEGCILTVKGTIILNNSKKKPFKSCGQASKNMPFLQ